MNPDRPSTFRMIFGTLSVCWLIGCATPGLMKRWEREEQKTLESPHFVVFVDDEIPPSVGREVLNGLEFARERVGKAFHYYPDEKIVCNLYRNEHNLRNVCVGLPLGFVLPRRAPLAYVLGGEVHGRLYCTPSGNVSRLWVSTFPHEYCHVIFSKITGRHYYQYSWLQEGLGEYFRRLYLQEKVLPPEFSPGQEEHFLVVGRDEDDAFMPASLRLRDRTRGIMSYTDWEVRTAMRYDELIPPRDLCPRTFVGYWRKFNTPKANQVYAISSSLVEFMVNEYGWRRMRELVAGLSRNSDLDEVMEEVYGFDQDGLFEKWNLYLRRRWPDPWQPNIAMVYLVRGNWEVDGHRAAIRAAMEEDDFESARLHWRYLNSRSIGNAEIANLSPINHSARLADSIPLTRLGLGATHSRYSSPPSDSVSSADRKTPVPLDALWEARSLSSLHEEDTPPAVQHYEAAMAAYSIGRFREGVDHLLTALEIEPEQMPSLRIHLARGFWLIGEQDKALVLYQDELLENKEFPFINEVAWCMERAGRIDQAIKLYRLIADSSRIPGLRKHARRRIDRLTYALPSESDGSTDSGSVLSDAGIRKVR